MATAQQRPSPDFATQYRDMMLQGLSREMQTTKRVVAAIPDKQRDYRPDPKARTAWELAWHIVMVDVQFLEEIAEGKFNMEPRYKDEPKTVAEMVSWYERNFTGAMERVGSLSGEQLLRVLDFYGVFQLPAFAYLAFVNNHSIHHRGELVTYLRPMGSKVPSIYGSSADEEWKAA